MCTNQIYQLSLKNLCLSSHRFSKGARFYTLSATLRLLKVQIKLEHLGNLSNLLASQTFKLERRIQKNDDVKHASWHFMTSRQHTKNLGLYVSGFYWEC